MPRGARALTPIHPAQNRTLGEESLEARSWRARGKASGALQKVAMAERGFPGGHFAGARFLGAIRRGKDLRVAPPQEGESRIVCPGRSGWRLRCCRHG